MQWRQVANVHVVGPRQTDPLKLWNRDIYSVQEACSQKFLSLPIPADEWWCKPSLKIACYCDICYTNIYRCPVPVGAEIAQRRVGNKCARTRRRVKWLTVTFLVSNQDAVWCQGLKLRENSIQLQIFENWNCIRIVRILMREKLYSRRCGRFILQITLCDIKNNFIVFVVGENYKLLLEAHLLLWGGSVHLWRWLASHWHPLLQTSIFFKKKTKYIFYKSSIV
jgi:hypothetical protein